MTYAILAILAGTECRRIGARGVSIELPKVVATGRRRH
jgi:hypothetical protein